MVCVYGRKKMWGERWGFDCNVVEVAVREVTHSS